MSLRDITGSGMPQALTLRLLFVVSTWIRLSKNSLGFSISRTVFDIAPAARAWGSSVSAMWSLPASISVASPLFLVPLALIGPNWLL